LYEQIVELSDGATARPAPRLDLRYDFEPVSAKEFARILRSEKFESFIGYPETARILEELAGVNIPVSRNQTTRDGILPIHKTSHSVSAP